MKRLAFALLLAASALRSFALTATVDGLTWTYTVSNGQASVGGGSNSSTAVPTTTTGAISIPATLGGYTVTSIGDWAFANCKELTEITIPATVTSIGDYAFAGCRGITELTIPDNVTSIGDYAFYYCLELISISIPDSVTSIGEYVFQNCSKLSSAIVGNGVKDIGTGLFYLSGLTSVTLGNSVTNIGNIAFASCGLTSITIPNGVTRIGDTAFAGCTKLTSITIPDGVTSIDEYAFQCTGLSAIEIPASVTSIGNWAFSQCSKLATIFIPESLASQADSWGLPSGCRIVEGLDVTVETVRVPKAWIYERAPAALAAANDDWATAARATAANGANQVWECYVAGLDPTNATSRFLATLSFDGNGAPSVGWTPDLGAERIYAVEGRATLTNAWGAVGDGSRFFRVRVAMPGGFGNATIAFDSAGGSAVAPITAAVGSAVVAPAAPTKTGYAFAGWSPDFPATMPFGGATLTAQWTPISYAVKFNANGGDGSMANQSFVYGTAQALASNAFTRARYAFAGWATSVSGAAVYANGQSVQNLSTTAGDLVNLYAVWEPAVDKVYWASIPWSQAGQEDLENVRPSSEQIKQMDSQNLTEESLAAGIQLVFTKPVIDGQSYIYWLFVAVPQSWGSKIAWSAAGVAVEVPQPVTREIDGIQYNTYIFSGGNNNPYYSSQMNLLLKNK